MMSSLDMLREPVWQPLAWALVHFIWQGLAAKAAILGERLSLKYPPCVFITNRIREAIVVGLWRPLVLLPASWLTEVPPEVLEAVIAHELAHVRRLDLWANLLQRLIETLLFYHPMVWWLSHRVSLEREMCADELAVEATGERLAYATALEHLGRMRLGQTSPQLAAGIAGKRMVLLSRVGNILGLSATNAKARWWPVGLPAIAAPLLPWVASMNVPAPTTSEVRAAEVVDALTATLQAIDDDNPLGLDDATLIKMYNTGRALKNESWHCAEHYRRHNRMPERASEKDPFAPNEDLRLVLSEGVPGLVQIWSVGPDGDWDGGRPIDSTKQPLDGDLGVEMNRDTRAPKEYLTDATMRRHLAGDRLSHYLAAKGPKLPQPELKEDGLKWGPVDDGLQLAVELSREKDAYYLGESIDVHFRIRNAVDYAIKVGLTVNYHREMASDNVFIHDENGNRLRGSSTDLMGMTGIEHRTLKPGETVTYDSADLALVAPGRSVIDWPVAHQVEAAPGVYTIRFRQHLATSGSDPHEWVGELETAPVAIRIAQHPKFAIHRVARADCALAAM